MALRLVHVAPQRPEAASFDYAKAIGWIAGIILPWVAILFLFVGR